MKKNKRHRKKAQMEIGCKEKKIRERGKSEKERERARDIESVKGEKEEKKMKK